MKREKVGDVFINVGNVGDDVCGVGNNDEVDECGFEESLRG